MNSNSKIDTEVNAMAVEAQDPAPSEKEVECTVAGTV